MATDKEFIVNKKFLLIVGTIFFIVNAVVVYALVSPKTVTVHVEKVDSSFQTKQPLEIVPPLQ